MDRWLQTCTLKKKDVTIEKEDKPAAHSITSSDEPTIKKDDNQATHCSVCLSEELSAKETICESEALPQSLFVKHDRSGAVGERPTIKNENIKKVT